MIATLASGWRRIVVIALGCVLAYYAGTLALLTIRFGQTPNDLTLYAWPANLQRIVAATPSWRDILLIAEDERLLDIGYIDPSFGHGVTIWSLTVLPTKVVVIALAGALLGVNVTLRRNAPHSRPRRWLTGLGGGAGAALAGIASASVTWVVCCGTPSWAVTLSILGVDIATALSLQPFGGWLATCGVAMLLLSTAALGRAAGPAHERLQTRDQT
ncbi:MAG: hypothetical protein JOZ58_21370, partial [Acetobacteraceae bacterium]|nr:hypothetical protein [Acetobacteraceae bacterium]